MIKKQYTGSARRARNIIWNAAGRYDFDPPFMAFFPNGAPDHYFNMIAGLVHKWLDMDRLWAFFARYGHDRRADEFDELLWLGLENCVYEKELAERPILEELRRRRAERFFREQQTLSRQQMEYQSMLAYTQQQARWAPLCHRRAPLLTPREARMAQTLRFQGTLDTDGVLDRMESFLFEFFRFTPGEAPRPRRAGAVAKLLLRHEHRRQDRLIVRAGTGEGNHPLAVQQRHEGLGRFAGPTAEDEAYIRAVFGRSLLNDRERQALEGELCVGPDAGCRLWITRGDPDETAAANAGAAEVRRSAQRQRERNETFFAAHAAQVRSASRDLSTRVETVLSSYLKHLPEPARAGRLRPEAAYRLPVLDDPRVFLKDGEEAEREICVDLLLDASQSRMHFQETLAAEAWIIADSLERLRIPVRVCAFRSLQGFTVLEVLKNWNQRDCRGLMRYFAAGWNRDSLALETLGRLDSDPAVMGKRRMLLILTDAGPNDSAPLTDERGRAREYEGAAAVKAAEDAVRRLRSDGLRVGAVFHGSTSHMEDLHQIYGHAYVRIRQASQLAQGVSDLMLMLLREMRRD